MLALVDTTKQSKMKKAALPVKKSACLQVCLQSKQSKLKPVYSKKGQVKPTPDEKDPSRRFYTSLLKQNKKSAMAKKWCIERGL